MLRFVLTLGFFFAWAGSTFAGETAADRELKKLSDRVASGTEQEQLRLDLLAYQLKHPGTTQAVQAAGLVRDLPSPLDKLDAVAIPGLEKFDWHPKETVAILGEHRGRQGGQVTAVAYSKHGKLLGSTSTNGYLRLWDPTTMRLLHTLGHGQGAYSVTFSKDNSLVATGGGDGQVLMWDITADKPKAKGTYKVASTPLMALALSPNGKWLVAGGSDSRVYLWDLSADPPREYSGSNGHTAAVYGIAYSPDGKTIASGGADKMIRLWTMNAMNQMKEKTSIAAHEGIVNCVAYHPTDDRVLLSGGADGVLRVWTVAAKLTPKGALKLKNGAINAVTFSASGKSVAAAFSDGTVRTYSYAAGTLTEKAVLEGHFGPAVGVAFAPDGSNIATGGHDWTVRLWPAVSGPRPKDKTIAKGHHSHVYTMAFQPDGAGLASGGYDRTVRLWETNTVDPKESPTILRHENYVYTLAFAPDGKSLAAGGASAKIRTYDLATGQFKALVGHTGQISRLSYAPDGRMLASCSTDKSIRIWNPKSGEGENTISAFETYVNSIAFSPDGKQLACASGYYLYDKNNQIVSKNGFILYNDSTVRLYEVGSFKEIYRWKYEKALMGYVAFAPDSSTLYAASSDENLRQLDTVKLPKEPDTFYKGTNPGINVMTCSPDGRWLASYGPDYRINIIDRKTGKKAREVIVGEQFGALAFAPDSRHLAIGVGTGVVLVLRLEPAKK